MSASNQWLKGPMGPGWFLLFEQQSAPSIPERPTHVGDFVLPRRTRRHGAKVLSTVEDLRKLDQELAVTLLAILQR